MIRRLAPVFLLIIAFSALPVRARAEEAPPRFAADIAAFETADRASPPPRDAVLFVGSSSVRFWTTLAEDFPGVPTINRGFGGSTVADCARYAPRIAVAYRPRRIVFYAGDNDVAAGRTPEQILADFESFVSQVRAAQPDVPILFISIKPSLARWGLVDVIRRTNALIRGRAAADKIDYVDVFTPMLAADGKPRRGLFRADGLHMTRPGYELWTRLVDAFVRADRPAVFPELSAETLEKRPVRLPENFEGERNLLLVAFLHNQQAEVDTWASRVKDFAAADPGLRVYEIPTIKKMNAMVRWFITSGMRRGIPDAAARDRTITLFIDKAPFERALKIEREGTIQVLVVNRAGEVLWRAAGAYDETKGASLKAFLAAPAR